MSIFRDFKTIDQKFAWSFIGVMLAIISGSITVYLEFIKDNKPNLNYIITANSSVLDIKEKIGNLDVLYRGSSLNQEKKDLRIITFKVINIGDSSILSNFYDPNDPIGFNVLNGDIADKPSLINASNKYLKEKLVIKQHNNTIEFSNVILESNEYFEVKVLILHSIEEHPEIQSIGKIAGVNSINVTINEHPADERSFLNTTFGGGLMHSALRTLVYGFLFLILIMSTLFMIFSAGEFKNKQKRKKIVNTFKDYDSVQIKEGDDYIFNLYIKENQNELSTIYSIMKSPSVYSDVELSKVFVHGRIQRKTIQELINTLIDREFLTQDGTVLTPSPERLLVLDTFISYLKRKGEFTEIRYSHGRPRSKNLKRVERKRHSGEVSQGDSHPKVSELGE
ncbi:hypothetical protein [Aeromonas sp. MR7]|uniref:hypothetical protein n=1 Tax=Aeromonas sp. MR7 TaxID=2923419 RepID=UPI001F4AC43C|nr:hypothetical protein [Aeromonas sp. MR7]MCH7349510.1 hypothetical protein [Aeromonas sp. MR7]